MTDFNLVLDVTRYDVTDPNTILTILLFSGLILLNFRITVPALDRAAAYLKAGKHGIAMAPEKPTFHKRLSTTLPAILGVWTFIVYAFSPASFAAYIQDGLVLWPDYGYVTPWLINAVGALALLASAGIFMSYTHCFGKSGGAMPGLAGGLLALACYAAGILAAPLIALWYFFTNRAMFIGGLIWGFKKLTSRVFPEDGAREF